MTGTPVPTSAAPGGRSLFKPEARSLARQASERRFRMLGLAAVLFGILALAGLLTSILANGASPAGADQRVLDKRLPDIALAALDKGEHARMDAAFFNRRMDRLGHDLARAGMGGMALDHDRAARGQRRRRVAARGRKGEREIRGAEDRHRAYGALDQLQVGARERLTVRQRRIMAAVEVVTVQDVRRE